MTTFDRRGLIGAAGASLVLASCKGGILFPTGAGFPHGELPNVGAPSNSAVKFEPKWIRAVYMRFDGANLMARQGYVPMPQDPSDANVSATAITALKALKTGSTRHFFNGIITEHVDEINLPCQMVLVLFIDNNPNQVRFEECNGEKYIVRFTPYSGERPEDITKSDIRENHAFFGMRKIFVSSTDTDLVGRVGIRIDFWNIDKDGKTITNVLAGNYKTYHRYSMNLHLQFAVAPPTIVPENAPGNLPCEGYWTPLILDPDTGNMGGEPT